jgi:hypothetical protein
MVNPMCPCRRPVWNHLGGTGGALEQEQEREEAKQRYDTSPALPVTQRPAHCNPLALTLHDQTALRFEVVLREIPRYCRGPSCHSWRLWRNLLSGHGCANASAGAYQKTQITTAKARFFSRWVCSATIDLDKVGYTGGVSRKRICSSLTFV